MAELEREALWAAEQQEHAARKYTEAACLLALRSGASRAMVQRVLLEQAQCIQDASTAPEPREYSAREQDSRKRRRRKAAQRSSSTA